MSNEWGEPHGSGPETLNWVSANVPRFANMLRTVGTFDGPFNIAFQEFPMLNLYPRIIHLATGGVSDDQRLVQVELHPVYGVAAVVGLDSGELEVLPSSSTDFHEILLGKHPSLFAHSDSGMKTELTATSPGVGELIASSFGYPSNIAFVTIPPQKFIGILFAEACNSGGDTTHRGLAAVVKNRVRLTKGKFENPPISTDLEFRFPPLVKDGGTQITARNAKEDLIITQVSDSIITQQFNSVEQGCTKESDHRFCDAQQFSWVQPDGISAYNNSVIVAGNAILDLLRTLNNSSSLWEIPQPDTNYLDLSKEPTGGSFFFYSPSDVEWGTTAPDGIYARLQSGSSVFPTKASFESDIVCTRLAHYFCVDSHTHAKYLQVVVVNGIPNNDCIPGKHTAPQFIFLRWRNGGDPSVIQLP